ncbi:MAG: hypothetical protein WCI91_03625 [Candidatus Nomurabacteria bacterium]
MKNKKVIYVLGIVILILLTVGAFYLKDNYSYLKLRLNRGAFLYTNPSDVLPQDKKISPVYYMNSFLKYEFESKYHYPEDKIFCVSTRKPQIIVKLFTKKIENCNSGLIGCQSSIDRIAIVCGNQYVIEENWLYGPQLYGVFDLK